MRTVCWSLLACIVAVGCTGAEAPNAPTTPPDPEVDAAPVAPPSTGGSGGSPGTGGAGGVPAADAAPPAEPDAGAPAVDAGPDPVIAGGMIKLFNGTTLEGWDGNPKIWSVKDGAIDGLSPTGGQLVYTKGDYDDFRLILESRLVSKTQHLGVCFWGERSPTWGYANCILVIPPSGGMWDYHKGIKSPLHMNPAKANVDSSMWHKSEILANAKTGEVRMAVNGILVLTYKNMTGLKKGPIGLQIHNGSSEVQYRELYLEENPKDPNLITVKP
jgi:hypothetical protein